MQSILSESQRPWCPDPTVDLSLTDHLGLCSVPYSSWYSLLGDALVFPRLLGRSRPHDQCLPNLTFYTSNIKIYLYPLTRKLSF